MNENKLFCKIVCEQLRAGSPVVLAWIVSWEGSVPRKSGTKMVVCTDGKSYGTVGGSLVEATAIAESLKVLHERRSRLMDFDLSHIGTTSQGMICGGKAVLLLDFIPPITENTGFFTQMLDSISTGRDFHFVTAFSGSGDAIDVFGHCLVFSDGSIIGGDFLMKPNVAEIRGKLHSVLSTAVISMGNEEFIIDPMRRFKTLYSFGAGHVALPTAHIAAMVGFQVVVIDDREEFASVARFPDANNVVVKDFEQAMGSLDIDKDSFIIILTRGHKYDRIVLEQAIKTDAGYIGMIGSKSKREAIYQALIASGAATAEQLKRVHSPIGLPIGGETPEEIAVSIVAELIQEREKQKA